MKIFYLMIVLVLVACGTIKKKKEQKVFRQNFAMNAVEAPVKNKRMKKVCAYNQEDDSYEVIEVKKGKLKKHLKNHPQDVKVGKYYPDMDGDGYGDADADIAPQPCPRADYVKNNSDCYDQDPNINPQYSEGCHEPRVRMCEDGRPSRVQYAVKVACLSCQGRSKGVCMNAKNKCRNKKKNGKCPQGFYFCGQELHQCI